ncbi:vacuolar sorting protein 9 (VPS9) domain-containing protein [Actinidia rufa]|uniref:Vacuolar sorting protein 9 (VPS9) domain-containing protein n=1 Tax=Actinidia rufa TaxID=165716 RepID=A0A7J0DTJ1_9ERIC|nr:vacuolar sorting protein 9 (VPS9) domain-containing protein [Actinidia rufa]
MEAHTGAGDSIEAVAEALLHQKRLPKGHIRLLEVAECPRGCNEANPPQLHSNLLYIQRYRRQSRLVSETAYFFTNILSAESFILNIDAKALSMEEAEYENNMESARALLSGLSADSDDLPSQSDRSLVSNAESAEPKQHALNTNKHQDPLVQSQFPRGSSETKLVNKDEASGKDQQLLYKVPSISDLENSGASMLMKEDQASRIFQDFPYLFSQAGDLTVNDVESLLNNYKHLVFKYVCLSKGMGIETPPPPLSISQTQFRHQDENVKESEDTKALESKKETNKDMGIGIENSEYKILQDEAAVSQGEGNDEISHR